MMWLPTKIYESLPVLYVAVGALLLLGALYIGVDHELMLGYMAVGSSCMIGGMFVTYIRRKARSQAESHLTRSGRAAT
jgi:hypothetical protein